MISIEPIVDEALTQYDYDNQEVNSIEYDYYEFPLEDCYQQDPEWLPEDNPEVFEEEDVGDDQQVMPIEYDYYELPVDDYDQYDLEWLPDDYYTC